VGVLGNLTRKVSQTDLLLAWHVIKVRGRSVRARLLISVCSRYGLFHPVMIAYNLVTGQNRTPKKVGVNRHFQAS